MRQLDRYVVRSFLYSMVMWLVVMLTLRVVADLFVNIDEFAEQGDELKSFTKVAMHVLAYYGYQSFVFFAQLGGVIIVAAAAFTIARMNYTNELTAMMASGVSLHRVLLPIILGSLLMSIAVAADREFILPKIAHQLVRDRDEVPGTDIFPVFFVTDENNAVWYSSQFYQAGQRMYRPVVIIRDKQYNAIARLTGDNAYPAVSGDRKGWSIHSGDNVRAVLVSLDHSGNPWRNPPDASRINTRITPEQVYEAAQKSGANQPIVVADPSFGLTIRAESFDVPSDTQDVSRGVLENPRFQFHAENGMTLGTFEAESARYAIAPDGSRVWRLEEGRLFFPSDLTVEDLKLRQSSEWMDYMSVSQLNQLLKLKRIPDPDSALLAKHIRFTEPLNNIVMLLIGIPFILSRERNVKASAIRCLMMVGIFYTFIYISRYLGLPPIWAAWLPVLVFGPIAAIMLDSVKT